MSEKQLKSSSALFWLTALPAVAIIVIGGRFLLNPKDGAQGYGIAATDKVSLAYGRVKGIRDIVSGLVVLAALRRGRPDELAAAMGVTTLTPITDLLIVLSNEGTKAQLPLSIHGGTALYMAAVTALLAREAAE